MQLSIPYWIYISLVWSMTNHHYRNPNKTLLYPFVISFITQECVNRDWFPQEEEITSAKELGLGWEIGIIQAVKFTETVTKNWSMMSVCDQCSSSSWRNSIRLRWCGTWICVSVLSFAASLEDTGLWGIWGGQKILHVCTEPYQICFVCGACTVHIE